MSESTTYRNMKPNSIQELDFENGLSMIQMFASSTQFVKIYFPKAQPSYYFLNTVKKVLAERNILPTNTLYAQSICPDEINHSNGGIAGVFEEYFGESFKLGGLAGISFTGSTGFMAFSHHVPDGNVHIFSFNILLYSLF
jgi:hypothetical protein